MLETKAIDIDCPACSAPRGTRCPTRFCQERLNEAARRTREYNAKLRKP